MKEATHQLKNKHRVIKNREVSIKDVSALYKSERKKARKMERELEIKDRVHKYVAMRIEQLEQDEREKEMILGPSAGGSLPPVVAVDGAGGAGVVGGNLDLC